MSEQRDLFESRAERDVALARVERPTLTEELDRFLIGHRGEELTGEDIRVLSGLEAHHPNAWGASINQLVRRGVLVFAGKHRHMVAVSSHARRTPVYRVISERPKVSHLHRTGRAV